MLKAKTFGIAAAVVALACCSVLSGCAKYPIVGDPKGTATRIEADDSDTKGTKYSIAVVTPDKSKGAEGDVKTPDGVVGAEGDVYDPTEHSNAGSGIVRT